MKKNLLIFALLAITAVGQAQNHLYTVDSAKMVLDKYLSLLNYGIISNDSTLFIESSIVNQQKPGDTVFMRRWFTMPNYYRIEVWHHDSLQTGYAGDGNLHFRTFNKSNQMWQDIAANKYYDEIEGYDFHGPLYRWKTAGIDISFAGTWTFNGHPVYRLYVKDPHRFYRYYLFEKETGLLFYVDEQNEHDEDSKPLDTIHVQWRAYNEYIPVGKQLFISTESYLYDNQVTVLHHKYRFLKRDMEPFYVDWYQKH